ncbi:E2L/OIL-like protein [Saltwater crocodilepox virus]|nr:E2L/OIL-like protein [Saltwater crocodilepox virus]AVD69421.1 E2L/OIL-like protein [Saltwater crocodilepox virus]QGT46525.1 ORF086 [Saltwater crocodilepox virus]QGT46741.1 ORF086 [Saltwater crocodilepox virus]QGT46957.1 ORF086 [Saltwater crocodilepox virus]
MNALPEHLRSAVLALVDCDFDFDHLCPDTLVSLRAAGIYRGFLRKSEYERVVYKYGLGSIFFFAPEDCSPVDLVNFLRVNPGAAGSGPVPDYIDRWLYEILNYGCSRLLTSLLPHKISDRALLAIVRRIVSQYRIPLASLAIRNVRLLELVDVEPLDGAAIDCLFRNNEREKIEAIYRTQPIDPRLLMNFASRYGEVPNNMGMLSLSLRDIGLAARATRRFAFKFQAERYLPCELLTNPRFLKLVEPVYQPPDFVNLNRSTAVMILRNTDLLRLHNVRRPAFTRFLIENPIVVASNPNVALTLIPKRLVSENLAIYLIKNCTETITAFKRVTPKMLEAMLATRRFALSAVKGKIDADQIKLRIAAIMDVYRLSLEEAIELDVLPQYTCRYYYDPNFIAQIVASSIPKELKHVLIRSFPDEKLHDSITTSIGKMMRAIQLRSYSVPFPVYALVEPVPVKMELPETATVRGDTLYTEGYCVRVCSPFNNEAYREQALTAYVRGNNVPLRSATLPQIAEAVIFTRKLPDGAIECSMGVVKNYLPASAVPATGESKFLFFFMDAVRLLECGIAVCCLENWYPYNCNLLINAERPNVTAKDVSIDWGRYRFLSEIAYGDDRMATVFNTNCYYPASFAYCTYVARYLTATYVSYRNVSQSSEGASFMLTLLIGAFCNVTGLEEQETFCDLGVDRTVAAGDAKHHLFVPALVNIAAYLCCRRLGRFTRVVWNDAVATETEATPVSVRAPTTDTSRVFRPAFI